MENAITCHNCSRIYKNKATYNQHITYKRCKVKSTDIIFHNCKYCEKNFSTKQNCQRHEGKCSKNVNLELEQKIKMVNDTLLEIKEMTGRNIVEYPSDVVPHSPTSQQIANTITNVAGNNITNIVINNFGEEDTSHITKRQILKALKMCKEFPLEMIKITHFDKERPENHNIYKPNFKDKYVKYFNDSVWKVGDATKLITELYMSKMDIAEEKFEEYKPMLSELTQTRFQWFLDNREEPDVMREILKKICEMLYNERGVITESK
jgi:hypothetical protein